MIQWKTPAPGDFALLRKAAELSGFLGNDCCAANIILYSKKYGTCIAIHNGFLLKRFSQEDGKTVWCFPAVLTEEARRRIFADDVSELSEACAELFEDAKNGGLSFIFALLTDEQRHLTERLFPGMFSFEETRDTEDYLYLSENLSSLPGKLFHKKKNHINQFKKKYSSCRLEPISAANKSDVLSIEEQWFFQNDGENDSGKRYEKEIITETLARYEQLELKGGILYADGIPCAFCIASEISSAVIDIMFEKAIMPFAKDGAYAVINNEFARTLTAFTYINREEDLGIEGLRKAKLSYYPEIILKKWNAARLPIEL